MKQPTVIDLFCGAGGLSLGLLDAGFNVLLGIDNDPVCAKTHALNPHHLPHAFQLRDARELDGEAVVESVGLRRGDLDLLAGGPPCQGFSVQRSGSDSDERNQLVTEFARLVQEFAPRYLLMENVAGLRGRRGKAHLAEVEASLRQAGYRVEEHLLDAQDWGVPQRRRRVFLLGSREDVSPISLPPAPRPRAATVREVIGHLPPPPVGRDHPFYVHHRADRLSSTNTLRIQAITEGQGRADLPRDLLAACHLRDAALIGHRNVYGRMRWDSVAPTITARFDSFTRGQFGHPEEDRTISLHEGLLLQTFPADFRFAGNKVDVARQIGNAVPPLLSRAIGEAMIRQMAGGQASVA